jgi:hypothetical protein
MQINDFAFIVEEVGDHCPQLGPVGRLSIYDVTFFN